MMSAWQVGRVDTSIALFWAMSWSWCSVPAAPKNGNRFSLRPI